MDAALTTAVAQVSLAAGSQETIDAPHLMFPRYQRDGSQSERVPLDTFPPSVLAEARSLGLEVVEEKDSARFAQGLWIAIAIDPEIGRYQAASPSVTDGRAFAY